METGFRLGWWSRVRTATLVAAAAASLPVNWAAAAPNVTITEFGVPTANADVTGIAAGPDGNLWFTEGFGNKIGRITTAGAVTEFGVPTASSQPFGIAAGPDGNLWFTEDLGNKIGRITTAGAVTEFGVPTASSQLADIAAGPDGVHVDGERPARDPGCRPQRLEHAQSAGAMVL